MGSSKHRTDFIYKVSTGSRKIRNLLTPIGFIFFFTLITLIVIVSLWVDGLLGLSEVLSGSYLEITGIPILAIGLFFMLWSVFAFARGRGTPVPFNPPPELVTSGPYAQVRNPMLSGLFIAMFGLGLLLGSIALAFVFTPLFVLLNVCEIRNIEEPELERRLGSAYIDYKIKVPRFFPSLRGKRQSKV